MFDFKITECDKYVYEKELRDFLPDEFIDFHTHIEGEDAMTQGDHNGGSSWTDLVSGDKTAEGLIDTYKTLFPDKKVMPLIFGGCLCDIDQVNEYVHEKGHKYGFPMLYRTHYAMTGAELEKKIKAGGFLGIKPYLSNCPSYIPNNEIRIFDFVPHEQLEVCDKNGWILMLHIPRNERFRDKVNIAQLVEIEEKYPNIKLIIAHIGRAYSKEDIGNAFEVVGKGKNTYFDFTANLCEDAIKACIEAVGTKKLIFGSDLPIAIMRMYRIVENGVYYNIVPRGLYGNVEGEAHMRETDETDVTLMIYEQLLAFKNVAKELDLSKEDVYNVLCGNAKRLLGIE